jgi:hypothetical protein
VKRCGVADGSRAAATRRTVPMLPRQKTSIASTLRPNVSEFLGSGRTSTAQ